MLPHGVAGLDHRRLPGSFTVSNFERNEQSREPIRDVSFTPQSPATFQMLCKANGLSAGITYYDIALAYSWYPELSFGLTNLAERGVQLSRWSP